MTTQALYYRQWIATELTTNQPATMPTLTVITEQEARLLPHCAACGVTHNPPGVGQLVCYRCFKHKTPKPDVQPLKWSGLEFGEWLTRVLS